MRLVDLDPRWVGTGGEGIYNRAADGTLVPAPERHGIGISFRCPCGGDHGDDGDARGYVAFSNPLDGGPPIDSAQHTWSREGETFETLTLRPSILRVKWTDTAGREHGCGWHGFITNGEVQTV